MTARARRRWIVAVAVLFGALIAPARRTMARPPDAPPSEDRVADGLRDGDIDPADVVGRALLRRGLVARERAAHMWVSLVGYSQDSAVGAREIGGLVIASFPLERLVSAPGARRVVEVPTIEPVLQAVSGGRPSPQEVAAVASPQLARECVAAAWRAAGLDAADLRIGAMATRARLSALLPEARVRAMRVEDERLSAETTVDESRLRDTSGANLSWEARLTWRLDRILYADDEPSLERLRLEHRDARTRIAGRALDALFHWQRASNDQRWAPPGTREEVDAAVRAAEAEATLDVLTGGWFTTFRARPVPTLHPSSPSPVTPLGGET